MNTTSTIASDLTVHQVYTAHGEPLYKGTDAGAMARHILALLVRAIGEDDIAQARDLFGHFANDSLVFDGRDRWKGAITFSSTTVMKLYTDLLVLTVHQYGSKVQTLITQMHCNHMSRTKVTAACQQTHQVALGMPDGTTMILSTPHYEHVMALAQTFDYKG